MRLPFLPNSKSKFVKSSPLHSIGTRKFIMSVVAHQKATATTRPTKSSHEAAALSTKNPFAALEDEASPKKKKPRKRNGKRKGKSKDIAEEAAQEDHNQHAPNNTAYEVDPITTSNRHLNLAFCKKEVLQVPADQATQHFVGEPKNYLSGATKIARLLLAFALLCGVCFILTCALARRQEESINLNFKGAEERHQNGDVQREGDAHGEDESYSTSRLRSLRGRKTTYGGEEIQKDKKVRKSEEAKFQGSKARISVALSPLTSTYLCHKSNHLRIRISEKTIEELECLPFSVTYPRVFSPSKTSRQRSKWSSNSYNRSTISKPHDTFC